MYSFLLLTKYKMYAKSAIWCANKIEEEKKEQISNIIIEFKGSCLWATFLVLESAYETLTYIAELMEIDSKPS